MPSRKTGKGPSVSQHLSSVLLSPACLYPKSQRQKQTPVWCCFHACTAGVLQGLYHPLLMLRSGKVLRPMQCRACSGSWASWSLLIPAPRSPHVLFLPFLGRRIFTEPLTGVRHCVVRGVAMGNNGGPSPEQETKHRDRPPSLRRSPTLSTQGSKSQVFFLFLKKCLF